MHSIHARIPKNFVLEERLERYADAIESSPVGLRGSWAEACHPLTDDGMLAYSAVRLDLGCGKGVFTCEMARLHPDELFVGIDSEPICIAYAAQHAVESGLPNVVFAPGDASRVTEYFSAGELAGIYLNFPTPFPRKKEAAKRLTHADHLADYRRVLAPNGTVRLKTDSLPLHAFSLTQVEAAGYELLWSTDDTRSILPDDPATGYELRLTAKGASVYGLEAKPGPEPERIEQTVSMSLIDYLPEDLSQMTYVPHGMEGTVANLRNRQARLFGQGKRG